MNLNTVVSYIGGTGVNQVASQTLATATETEIQVNTASGTSIAILTIPQVGDIVGSATPQDPSLNPSVLLGGRGQVQPRGSTLNTLAFDNSRPFLVRLAGLVTPASNAGNTFQLKLYNGTSKSGTAIAATGATTGFESSTTAGGFVMEARCIWDSTSQVVAGEFMWLINSPTPSYHVWQTNSALATSVTAAKLQFCASVQWGNAAGGVVAVSEFSISRQ